MKARIATLVCVLGIIGLLRLVRDPKARISKALWIPVIWMFLAGSQSVGGWLQIVGFGGYGGGGQSTGQYLEGSELDRNVFMVLTALGIYVLLKRGNRTRAILAENWPILLFFFYCAVSVTWSDYPDVAVKRWIKAIGDLVMVLIVLTETNRVAAVKRWFAQVGFVLLPLSVLFIKYYPQWGRNYYNPLGIPAYVGVTTSKNILGMITLIFGLSSWWCFLQALKNRGRERERGYLIAHAVILATAGWLFWTANSATSLSCFLMGTGVIAVTSWQRLGRKPVVVLLLVLVSVSVPLFAIFSDSGGGLLGAVGRESTLTGRTDIWKLALSMAGSPMFGTGFESFWLGWRLEKVWNVYRFHLQEAHNGYIELYLTLGWMGVLLFAVVVVAGYRKVIASLRREPDLGRLKLTLFVVALVYNLTEAAIRTQNPIWIIFLMAIVGIPQALVPSDAKKSRNHRHVDELEPQVQDLLPARSGQEIG